MYAIPITRYPIVPTSFRGVTPRDYIYSISHARSGSGSQAQHNYLLIKEITWPETRKAEEGQESYGL